MPFALSIEPSSHCQLSCPECPTGIKQFKMERGELSLDLLKKIVDEVYKKTFYLNLYFQGEPLFNRQLPDMIAYARKYRMFTVLSTNAQLLDEETAIKLVNAELSKIIISMDGFSQNTYSKYRIGGEIEKVKVAVDFLINAKLRFNLSSPKIVVQFIVNRFNEPEIQEFLTWANQKKVKAELKTMQIYKDFSFLPVNEKYRRYKKNDNGWELKKQGLGCFRIWSQCVITYDGNVLPCCFDKNSKYILGNLNSLTLHNVWNSKKFNNFRYKVLNKKNEVEICSNCTE